jgi:hypothetical protein
MSQLAFLTSMASSNQLPLNLESLPYLIVVYFLAPTAAASARDS